MSLKAQKNNFSLALFFLCLSETQDFYCTQTTGWLINTPTLTPLIPEQNRAINLLCICISSRCQQNDIPHRELLVSYTMLLYKQYTITLCTHKHKHTHVSIESCSLCEIFETSPEWEAYLIPFWFPILLQIGHSLIKRWKNFKHMLSSLSGTSNRRITVACFGEGFGPTGPLPCTYIS